MTLALAPSLDLPELTCNGLTLDPSHLGLMEDSSALLDDMDALRARMETDGYLFLPGFYNRADVLAARRDILEKFRAAGQMDDSKDLLEGILREGANPGFRADMATTSAPVSNLVYGPTMMSFFDAFLGAPALHYTFTWMRSVPPGHGTHSHCDVVYMGRGTHQLYTAWSPLGDVDFRLGGLIVLEGSHKNPVLLNGYCKEDVDAYCANKNGKTEWEMGSFGGLGMDVNETRRQIGGRWLAREFSIGDVVLFSVNLVHGGLDNRTANRVRLSTDTRYQLASAPVDERWIGEEPIGHGAKARKALIC